MNLLWKNATLPIGELKPYKFNPRKISAKQLERLKTSIDRSGYNSTILVDTDHTIIAGHQRWHTLKALGYTAVDVRVPDRKLSEDEFKEINVKDNLPYGEWDLEILSENFNINDLIDWGLDEHLFSTWDSDINLSERDGARTDATIVGQIIITCPREQVDSLKDAIGTLVAKMGIEIEIKSAEKNA